MMSKNPLVSILMANYNNGQFMQQSVDSVLAQSYTDWEIIIVDDASTDDSWSIIKTLASKDARIHISQNTVNLKVAATKAKATALSAGAICAILDPDDVLVDTALEKHVEIYSKNPECSLVASNFFICDEQLKVEEINTNMYDPESNYSYLSSKGGINHFWSFQKNKYQECGGFNPKFILAEDQDLYYKLEEVGRVEIINEPLYYYRIHKNSISKNDKVALAFVYHLFAKLEAKNRRKKNALESQAIKASILNFMEWGITKIDKSMRFKILRKSLKAFPELTLEPKILSSLYHLK